MSTVIFTKMKKTEHVSAPLLTREWYVMKYLFMNFLFKFRFPRQKMKPFREGLHYEQKDSASPYYLQHPTALVKPQCL